ncbi:carbohydrate ABC transporter substrate-binding protein [Streptomyces sp. A7024]|uniref:Carbohydrate ABC transporter substrate-binding protein n=1 Tax=Streptomyces coryli TaxID=1128680 RepID=A0A6G4U1A0_9ACTN|nr:ABC transporter substrate-binding protein [Streptomyces coryli]NGN66039.1 carbohydrate ABC transporter substrate-binding protein [Streptomyces coryli]
MPLLSSMLTRATTVAAVLATLATAGCATTDDSGAANAKSFTYWSMWTRNEPQAKVLKSAISDFTEETGINVDVEWQGRKSLDKVGPAMLSGKAPDVVDQSFDMLLPTLAAGGQLKDVSPVLDLPVDGGKKVKDVVPGKLLSTLPKAKGARTWLVPYETATVSLFYNGKDPLVGKAPKTFDELLDICEAAKAKGKVCIGSDADQGWASLYWFDYLLHRNGGSMKELAGDKSGAAFKDPAVVKSARQVETLVKNGYLGNSYDATKYPEQQNNWAAGKSVFMLLGSWLPTEVEKFRKPGFEVRSVNFPTTGAADRTAGDVVTYGFAMPKTAKNVGPAQEFMAFFLRKQQLAGLSSKAGNITPRSDVPAPAELADAAKQLQDDPARLANEAVSNDWRDQVAVEEFNQLWLGKTDAEGFVKAAAKASASYWKAKG